MSESFFNQVEFVISVLSEHISVDEKFARLRPTLTDPDVAREFWNHLEDPAWLTLLHREGYFASPPSPEEAPNAGLRFPIWPASKYLARMAAQASTEVAAIFAGLTTDNASVIGDILDAALAAR